MKRLFTWFLVIVIFSCNVCFATPKISKTESVFINLDYYGDVEQINVYNSYGVLDGTKIVDYGEYESITNLTDKSEYKVGEDGERIWEVSGINSFSYMGKMNNLAYLAIPWNFDVSYKLNGVLIKPEDLLHKSGTVEIDVEINANENTNEYYKNNYMLEITGSFDMSDYLSVESDEAMFVSAGNTKTMMFIVLPGQSTDFKLRIGSNDFEMGGLTFAMVPLEGDMLDKISEFSEDKDSIEDAMEEINKSTDIVLYAMKDMSAGMSEMKEGMQELKGGTNKLHELSPNRDESISKLIDSTEKLRESIKSSKVDLENLNDMLDDVLDMFEELNIHIKSISNKVKILEDDISDIEEIIEDLPNSIDNIKDIMDTVTGLTYDMAKLVEAQDNANNIDTVGLKNSLTQMGTSLYAIQEELQSPDMATITDPVALSKLSSIGGQVSTIGYELENVQDILVEIDNTLSDATTSQNGLSNKLKKLSKQIDELNDEIDSDDGEVVIDSVSDMKSLMKELRETLDVTHKYTEKILKDRKNITDAIDNLKTTLDNMDDMMASMNFLMKICQDMLDILSNDLYNGGNQTIDGVISITDHMLNVTGQADQFIYSKDKAKDVIKKQWDKIDDETNLFKIKSDAKVVSFASSKNDEPDKVQFLLKLPDIMEVDNKVVDLESEQDNGTFWSRVVKIIEKMFGWIINIFKKN